MTKSREKWAVLCCVGTLVCTAALGATSTAFALTVTTTGSTSTFIAVFSTNVAVNGYSSFTFVSSTKLFTVSGTSSLQGLTFTNATGTGNLQSATFIATGVSSLQGFTFTNATGTGNLKVASLLVTGTSTLNGSVVLANPLTPANGGTGASTYTYGVVVASSTNSFTTITAGANGNVLTSDGSVWQSAAPSSQTSVFKFGEAASSGDALYMSDGTNSATTTAWDATAATGNDTGMGNSNTNSNNAQQVAETFSTSTATTVTSVDIRIKMCTGTGSDNVVLAIQADNGSGQPSGTDLATSSLAGSSVTGSYAVSSMALSQNVALTGGTTYWFILRRSGALDNANYYCVDSKTSNVVPEGVAKGYNGTSWANMDSYTDSGTKIIDFYLKAYAPPGSNGTQGLVYRASASDTNRSDAFIGFANSNVSTNATGTVTIGGLFNNLSSLIIGKRYYLGNSAGTISTAPGSVTRKVGIAVTTTTLDITNSW